MFKSIIKEGSNPNPVIGSFTDKQTISDFSTIDRAFVLIVEQFNSKKQIINVRQEGRPINIVGKFLIDWGLLSFVVHNNYTSFFFSKLPCFIEG